MYLQSMIMVRVSLSLASWKGGWPQTNMNSITPRLQISEEEKDTRSDLGLGDIYHGINRCNITRTFINTSISQTQIWLYDPQPCATYDRCVKCIVKLYLSSRTESKAE